MLSVLIFYIFRKVNLKEIKFINLLASSCFGIYLIQSHTFIAGHKLYKYTINTEQLIDSPLLIVQALISIVAIYLIGGFVDLLRRKLLEDKIMKIKVFDKFIEKIDNAFNN